MTATPDRRAAKPQDTDTTPDDDTSGEIPNDTYEPSTVEVNRAREQGLGVGQKDLDYQRDPVGTVEEREGDPEPWPRVRAPDPLPPDLDPPA